MILSLLFSCMSDSVLDSGSHDWENDLQNAIAKDIEETGASAFAMAVIRDGALIWSEGFGNHTKSGVDVTGDTLFRVASLTKPMTAIATLQQVDQGCLGLQNPVDQTIEDFVMLQQPSMAAELTVAQTLNMSGGLADYQLLSGEDGDGQIENFLPVIMEYGYFLSPPGRMYNYSNTNYVLAGRLVELCSGDHFRPVMEDHLWTPLSMTSTTFSTSDVVEDGNYAMGVTTHWPDQPGVEVETDAESFAGSHLWPAMGAWSSVNDLAQLALFLMDGNTDILSSALHEEMTSMQVDSEEGYPSKGYGYGLNVKTGVAIGGAEYPVTMVSHVGSIYGSSAHMYLFPDLDVGVIAILNRDDVIPAHSVPVALDLASRATSESVTIEVPTAFDDYVGSYFNEFNIGTFIVTSDESGLQVEIPTLDDAGVGYISQLEAVRPDNFLLHYPDGGFDNLSFIRDEAGAVEYVRQRNYVGQRVDGRMAPSSEPVNVRWQTWPSMEAANSVFP